MWCWTDYYPEKTARRRLVNSWLTTQFPNRFDTFLRLSNFWEAGVHVPGRPQASLGTTYWTGSPRLLCAASKRRGPRSRRSRSPEVVAAARAIWRSSSCMEISGPWVRQNCSIVMTFQNFILGPYYASTAFCKKNEKIRTIAFYTEV